MANGVLLLGGTDLTLAVAATMVDMGITPDAIVYVGKQFSISYSPDPVTNVRRVDLEGWAIEHKVKTFEFKTYDDILKEISAISPQACLVAGWYHLVPKTFRNKFPRGCFGFHASLLPKFRGGAPLNWSLLTGESEAGVSLFELSDGVDDGKLAGQISFPINARDTIDLLVDRAREASAELVRRYLAIILAGEASLSPQEGEPTYCLQRQPSDGGIDWRMAALEIDRLVRSSSHPYPGAFSTLNGKRILIWKTEQSSSGPNVFGVPGQLFVLPGNEMPFVVTGRGLLQITDATDVEGSSVLSILRRANHQRFDVFQFQPH